MPNARQFFASTIAGFLAGVALSSYLYLGISFVLFLCLTAGAVFVMGFSPELSMRRAQYIWVSVFLLFFALGVIRFGASILPPDAFLESHVDQRVTLVGELVREPVGKDNYRQLVLSVHEAQAEGGAPKEVSARVLVYAPFYPEVSYGDRLKVEAKLSKPGKFETDRGGVFDFSAFLLKDGIAYQMFYPSIEVLNEEDGSFFLGKLFRLKSAFLARLERVIPEPHASLLGGILLGAEESLGEELVDKFRQTGLIHIVVLSGYNVTIVAESIRLVFSKFLPFYASGFLGFLSIIIFALLVGPSATVLRASIMAILAVVARMSYRPYAVGRALFLAGALMVLWNPRILVFDSSFQLSFLATLGLVYLSPLLEPYFHWITKRAGLREIVLATVSTQVTVLPAILYKMGIFSLVSLPVNVLALPAVPASMLFGFLTGLAGFAHYILSLPFAYISYFLLEYMLKSVEIFNAVPYSFLEVGIFSFWWLALAYALLAIFFYRIYRKQNPIPELERLVSAIEIVEVVDEGVGSRK